jgi:hypothetical protein
MSRTIEAKAVISAADKTGAVFDRLAQKIKGLTNNAKALGDVKAPKFTGSLDAELKRLKLSEKELMDVRRRRMAFENEMRAARPKAEHFFRADAAWVDREVQHWRKMKSGIDEAAGAHKRWRSTMVSAATSVASRGLAMAGGAYAGYRVAKAGVTSAATAQRESARDYLAGLSDEDSKRLEAAALEQSKKFKSIDSMTMHERLRDTAMSTRSVDMAIELADTIGQMTTVMQSLKGKDAAVEEGRKFFKALDNLGKNVDPKEIRQLAQGFVQAQSVEGADMNLGDVMTMARRMKSAGATIDNRFLYTTGVALAQDMGADRAGNSLAMMMQQEVQATAKAKDYGRQYGLRDKSGQFVDRSLMMSKPDEWAWKNISEAMKRAKLDPAKAEDVNTFLGSAYSNSSARDVLSKLMTQREQYEGKKPQFGRAPGLEAAGPLMQKDPFVAYEAVLAQLRTLAGQAPVMDATADALGRLSSGIQKLGDAIGEGYKDGGWLDRFLKEGKKHWDATAREVEGVKSGVNWLLDMDKKTGIDPTWLGLGKRDVPYPAGEDPMGSDYSAKGFRSKEYWEGLGRQGADATSAARLRAEAARYAPQLSAPGVTQTMTYGTGLQSQADVEKSANVNVQGEVSGEMEGTFKFVVDSSGLIQVVDEMKKLSAEISGRLQSIGGNGPGSTGRSSPDAQAPGGTGFSGVY